MKSVYVVMCAEFFHHGHLNIIQVARELGEVTVGLATDEFNARYKRLSVMSYEQRKAIVENVKGVKRVVPQETLDLVQTLRQFRPDYFVHGDDWQSGPLYPVRQQVLDALREWGGELVEPAYTAGISSTALDAVWRATHTTPESRIHRFRRMLVYQPFIRILEAHDGLAAQVVGHAQETVAGKRREFDAMWFSSRPSARLRDLPDLDDANLTAQLPILHDILGGTTKPLIVDGRSGGTRESFPYTVRTLERLGVAAVAIEESHRPSPTQAEEFAAKISAGKQAQATNDFTLIAGVHVPPGAEEQEAACRRAREYVTAGADALVIHSHNEEAEQLLAFCGRLARQGLLVPSMVMLPAGSSLTEEQLVAAGVQLVIYPDQLLHAAYTSMQQTAAMLLAGGSAGVVEQPLGRNGLRRGHE